MDRLVGEHVKLLVGVAPLVKGTICVVRDVLTYRGAELPEDPLFLEHDGTAGLLCYAEMLEEVNELARIS